MVDFLNDDVAFEGDVTTRGELIANGGLTIGAGGARYGQPASEVTDSWPVHSRIRVADVAERDELVAWRTANAPISPTNPLLVWRADGSLTGVQEVTTDGVNWCAESPMAGDIEMTLAGVAPYGWALMQGQILANAAIDYPALWANVDGAFKGGGAILIPDMRSRSPLGAGQGPGMTMRNLGNLLGSETVGLTTAQLPPHNHTGTTNAPDRSLNHDHWTKFGHLLGNNPAGDDFNFEVHDPSGGTLHRTSSVSETTSPGAGASLVHLHTFTTANTGSGQSHPNMQPSTVVNFKVKL